MGFRRRRKPVVPGHPCPAERTNASRDPKVTITETGRSYREGTRPCGRCGRPAVPVRQSWGDKHTAWYYAAHTVPVHDQGEKR